MQYKTIRIPVNDPEAAEEELNAFLRAKRVVSVREEHGVPAYAVFTNEQLATIARKPPVSLGDLEGMSGIGRGKADAYGAAILEVVKPPAE